MLTEADLTPEELAELGRQMETVKFTGNYMDLGEQEEIRRDFLREVEVERAR